MAELPETQEILAEHLYKKVYSIDPTSAERVTGMLIECGDAEIYAMLKNDDLLQYRMSKALQNSERETIAEVLYESVQKTLQNHDETVISKVTGMLLEMDEDTLQKLLSGPELLRAAIDKALRACDTTDKDSALHCDEEMSRSTKQCSSAESGVCDTAKLRHSQAPLDCVSNASTEETDVPCTHKKSQKISLGEVLFEKIVKLYPEKAPKITGMLLEQDVASLQWMLQDDGRVKLWADKALTALADSGRDTL